MRNTHINNIDPEKEIRVFSLLEKVRRKAPVIHHLTNWVTIYDCAQVVKSIGASPVMAHAPEEVEDMAEIASALVFNIGTLTVDFIESMKKAGRKANKKGIPVVLDVCGAGATKLRDDKCRELIDEIKISVIKGNSSEIARIAGLEVKTKGVDSFPVSMNIRDFSRVLATRCKSIIVVTGESDLVTDGNRIFEISNGDKIMADLVGTGCMATSVIGAFAAVEPDLAKASVAGLVCFEVAAELAARSADGPGSFKQRLYDSLYKLDSDAISRMQKIKC